jgi:hypothetical protein
VDYLSLTFIIVALLIFFDGIIFGVAAAKAVTSIILVVLGLIIAAFVGLAIPFLGVSAGSFLGGLEHLVISSVNRYGPGFFAMPIFWIIGFLVGIFVV